MNTAMKALPILTTLWFTQKKHKKDYSFPAHDTILGNLAKYLRTKISKRTLCRWMRVTEDEKYLIRIRRISRHPIHGMVFNSTLYKITIKGYMLLKKYGANVSRELANFINWVSGKKAKNGKKRHGQAKNDVDSNGRTRWDIKKEISKFCRDNLTKIFM